MDFVKSQILIAAGARLSEVLPARDRASRACDRVPHQRRASGEIHASAGKITAFQHARGIGVRVDTAMYAEAVVPPYYDSLIAKLIVRGKDRAEAIARMARALDMFIVEGIHTSIPLHRRIMKDAEFIAGRIDTKFMERFLAEANAGQRPPVVQTVPEARTETAAASVPDAGEQATASPRKRRGGKRVEGRGRRCGLLCTQSSISTCLAERIQNRRWRSTHRQRPRCFQP